MPRAYTVAERADMVRIYYEYAHNAAEAARQYRIQFEGVRVRFPNHASILRAVQDFNMNGNVLPGAAERVGRPRTARSLHNEERVLEAIAADPGTSTRQLERGLEISRSTVNRITKDNALHPYHATKVQHLELGDYEMRRQFCNQILNMHREDPNFLRHVLWTDESPFTREGCFNPHNVHQYAIENPHFERVQSFQHRWKINMWGGIIGDTVILYQLPETLNVS